MKGRLKMIHSYKLGGLNIVLDICSGSVHSVDEVAYDIIAMFENNEIEALTSIDEVIKEMQGIQIEEEPEIQIDLNVSILNINELILISLPPFINK